ncbi:bifunctional DNA primase/polymerase [Ochrobactrum cytisi]|nr:bifunctional DNA primase/polymerase [Brucella cytisi]
MLDLALSYISHGIPVFPCRAGDIELVDKATGEITVLPAKAPLTSKGLKNATSREHIIRARWDKERHGGAMVGIPTGERSGIFVLDVDMHHTADGTLIDGKAALAALEAANSPLPKTAMVKTAGGGLHYYFNHVDGVRNRGALSKGLDVRGEGGFVIAAGSVTTDGRTYEWIDQTARAFLRWRMLRNGCLT